MVAPRYWPQGNPERGLKKWTYNHLHRRALLLLLLLCMRAHMCGCVCTCISAPPQISPFRQQHTVMLVQELSSVMFRMCHRQKNLVACAENLKPRSVLTEPPHLRKALKKETKFRLLSG